MPLRRTYWAARRRLVRRDVLAFVHTGLVQPNKPPADAPRINISGAGPISDAVARGIARQSGLTLDIIKARLDAGHLIVHANADDGALLAWGWIALADHTLRLNWETGLHLQVAAGIGYLFDFETMPAARNRGLYRQLLAVAVERCFANGARLIGIYCRADNAASRRGILAAGFANAVPASVLRLGPMFRVKTNDRTRWGWAMGNVALAEMLHT
ncbi:MAG: GNAT family N-acetyltransferase [Acetobacteraceae bacterium]|nr:GNAT family N-acetyltransferase [Acetobacteraceae bacterium]